MCRYDNLEKMLNESTFAKQYFDALPNDVRAELIKKGLKIYTENEMMDYAEGLIHEFI